MLGELAERGCEDGGSWENWLSEVEETADVGDWLSEVARTVGGCNRERESGRRNFIEV